jgi:hypothetical protein
MSLQQKGANSMRVTMSCGFLFLLAVILFIPPTLVAQTSPHDGSANPLSAAEYGKLLDRIETDLRIWEPAIRKIDPGKGDTSYKVGSDIAESKDLALLSIQNSLNFIGQQRTKHTVYGEFSLAAFLDSVNAELFQLSYQGAFNDLSVEKVGSFGTEMGNDQKDIKNDGMRRLRLLEDSPCAH